MICQFTPHDAGTFPHTFLNTEMVSGNFKYTSPFKTRRKRESNREYLSLDDGSSSLDDGSPGRNTSVASENVAISSESFDSEALNIAQEFAKLDPENTGWIHDYHLAEFLVRIMRKEQMITTDPSNETFRNLRSPEPDREGPLAAYLHYVQSAEETRLGVFNHYFEQRRIECWQSYGISIFADGESPKEILAFNRKTIGNIIEKVGLCVSEDNGEDAWNNQSIRIIHIDDAVRLIPHKLHLIKSVFDQEMRLRKEDLKRKKRKRRGKPPPREIKEAVANGVKLGCSKCRYQLHGCTRCRKKAGLFFY